MVTSVSTQVSGPSSTEADAAAMRARLGVVLPPLMGLVLLIGFWVWDEWNNLKVEHIIIAIFVIGIVGLVLEQTLIFLARQLHTEG